MDITWTSTLKSDWFYSCSQRWRSSIQSAKTRLWADCGSDHELLVAKFRLKLKKVGKTTRPFRYDLNQIPYYCIELRLQSLNPTQHQSCWRLWGAQLPPGGPRKSTCLDLPRDLVLRRLSCLNLFGDPSVHGSQEVDMPQLAQGPNSWEADMPQPAWEFNL